MRSFFNTIVFLVGIVAFGGIAVLVVFGSQYLYSQYENLDPRWSAGLLIVSVVLLICTTLLAGAIRSVSANKDKTIHPEKAVVYGNFIELWSQTASLQPPDDAQKTHRQKNKKQLMLWAADNVLKEYLKLEKLASTDTNTDKIGAQAEKVILAIRKDLGNRNWGLLKGDLKV